MTEVQTPQEGGEKPLDPATTRGRVMHLLDDQQGADSAEIRRYMEDGTIDRLQTMKEKGTAIYYHGHRWFKGVITDINLQTLMVTISLDPSDPYTKKIRELSVESFLYWQEQANDNVKRLIRYEEDGTIAKARGYIGGKKPVRVKRSPESGGGFEEAVATKLLYGGLQVKVVWDKTDEGHKEKDVDTKIFLKWQEEN